MAVELGPLSRRVAGLLERLATVKFASPAPTFTGDTLTARGPMLAVTSIGAAARGLFGKSLEPQPAAEIATTMLASNTSRRPLSPEADRRILILSRQP